MTIVRPESVKINPRDFIQLIEHDTPDGPMAFARTLRKHFAIYDGPKSFTFSLIDFNKAKILSKYKDELPGEEYETD